MHVPASQLPHPDTARPHILALGLSRQSAAVALRERLALALPAIIPAVGTLITAPAEMAVLATCHRFEIYFALPDAGDAIVERICTIVHEQTGLPAAAVRSALVVHRDAEAAQHLCRVAAGLDSAVLGEAQIQGQVVAAYTHGLEEGSIGPALSLLFRTAIRAGKRARAETSIAAHATSMSSLALRLVEQRRGRLEDATVLVIGAGEMARLALKALAARRVAAVTVANRTPAHARAALLDPRWRAAGLDALPDLLTTADVVVSATAASDLVVTAEAFAASADGRRRYLIDLAVPRDIDPALRGRTDVMLIDVDDLREELDAGLADRLAAVPEVDSILVDELTQWEAGMTELAVRPLVVELRRRAERIREEEVARTLRFLGDPDDATQAHIQHLSRALVNKLLHEPTTRIRELAHAPAADQYAATICHLFGLNGQTNGSPRNGES